MITADDVAKMSHEEKLQAMEVLWEGLTADPTIVDPPSWHSDALKDTTTRFESGDEKPIDWLQAKAELRQRAR